MRTLKSIKGHIKELLAVTDYKSIKAIQKENPMLSRKEVEEWLLDNYNEIVEEVNKDEDEEKKLEKQLKEQFKRMKKKGKNDTIIKLDKFSIATSLFLYLY